MREDCSEPEPQASGCDHNGEPHYEEQCPYNVKEGELQSPESMTLPGSGSRYAKIQAALQTHLETALSRTIQQTRGVGFESHQGRFPFLSN